MVSIGDSDTFIAEYKTCLNHLLTLAPEKRTSGLEEYLKTCPEDFRENIMAASQKERHHISLVRGAMKRIGVEDSIHDWSKDIFYFFITNGKFHFQIKSEELEEEFLRVVENHYLLEPHHPEWERIHNKSCSPEDVREMAVDRCCRNVWANNGAIEMDQMRKFLPKFTFDHERKLADYLRNVEEVNEIVKEYYVEFMKQI